MIIVLVCIKCFQDYIHDNLEQLLELNFTIHLITEKKFFIKLKKYKNKIKLIDSDKLNDHNIDNKSSLSNERDGFWISTSKRFFLIYEYMKKYNIKNALHLENDVLLYNNMKYKYENKIYLTMDSNDRCIPGIIYIPTYELLNNLIEKYDFNQNDMINLGNFYNNNKDIVNTFPIINNSIEKCIFNENFSNFKSIFDAAAIGQYLGGVDPRNQSGNTIGFINETCIIKYNNYKFKWFKNGEHKLPYIEINNNYIPINNLHIHSKNLKKFRINKKYSDINFITGEKIQLLCDHNIGKIEDFNFNPRIRLLNNKSKNNRFIELGKVTKFINNKKLVFCYTHLLNDLNLLIKTLKYLKNPFKLIFHNSDTSFNKEHLKLFNKLPLLQHIYSQNLNIVNSNISYLPIGIANSQWVHGNLDIFKKIYNKKISKDKDIFFNFNIDTNKEKRQYCYDILSKKGLQWTNNLDTEKYLIELKKHKYCICPEGNGLDTHRFWECLYMDTIPICSNNKLTR